MNISNSGMVRHVTVCGGPGQYAGWPANGGSWSWGNELLVGFALGRHKEQVGHTRDAATMRDTLARSLDGGETWAIEPGPVAACGDLDPTSKRKIAAPTDCPGGFDFTNPDFALAFRAETFFISEDRGRRWQGPFRFPEVGGQPIQGRTDYLVEDRHRLLAMLTVTKQDGREGRVGAFRTEDGGRTWRLVSWVGPEPPGFSIMPATVRLSDSRLLCVTRCREGIHRWLSREESEDRNWLESWVSEDNAATWRQLPNPVADTGWGGSPPALAKLADGRLCLVYAWRGHTVEQPSRICARYSANGGETWGPEIVLRGNDGANFDVGYPRLTQRPDGILVALYYYNHGLLETPSYRTIDATLFAPPAG
jgi:hypothetical protein